MNPYEKIIKTMRNEANNGVEKSSFGLAVMTGADSLTYNGMEFEAEDCLFADHLLEKRLKNLDFKINDDTPSENEGHHVHPWTDKSKYIPALKSGDTVFGILISTDEDQKFLVLCRIGG